MDSVVSANGATKLDPADSYDVLSCGTIVDTVAGGVATDDSGGQFTLSNPGLATGTGSDDLALASAVAANGFLTVASSHTTGSASPPDTTSETIVTSGGSVGVAESAVAGSGETAVLGAGGTAPAGAAVASGDMVTAAGLASGAVESVVVGGGATSAAPNSHQTAILGFGAIAPTGAGATAGTPPPTIAAFGGSAGSADSTVPNGGATATLDASPTGTPSASAVNAVVSTILISTGAGNLSINLELDANAAAAPASYISGWKTAATLLSEDIHDPITVNIEIGYTEYPGDNSSITSGSAEGGAVFSTTDTYTQLRNFLSGTGSSDVISAVNDLPTTSSLNGQTNFSVADAEAKAWKQISATNTAIDGYTGYGSGIPSDAIVGVALHEFTHAMGRVPGDTVLFLFDYTSSGSHYVGNFGSASYFSVDGGKSVLADFGINSDPSDFLNNSLTVNDPFDEFYTPGSTLQSLTTLDQTMLDMLGFGGTLSGSTKLSAATEATALASSTQIATFTDGNTSDLASGFTASISWGDGSAATTGTVTGSNGSFTVSAGHTYADEASDALAVTITRTADNAQLALTGTVIVAEGDVLTPHGVTFTATTNQAFSGTVATFTDSDTITQAGDLTASITWSDGSTATTGTVSGSNGSFTVSGTHTYTTAAQRTVSVVLSDDTPGTATATASSTATVVGGTLSGSTKLSAATEGTALASSTQVATFTDSDTTDLASGFTASISWGDGSAATTGTVTGSNGSFTVSAGHTYADEAASDALAVTITRTADNTPLSLTGTVVVAEGDVFTPQGVTFTATSNQAFSGTVATFTDSDTITQAGDLTASITWGDGSAATTGTVSGSNGSFTVSGTHTYTTAAQRTVSVVLSDNTPGTATATASSTATVATVANDFYGTGSSDILWQNTNGKVAIWEMNGSAVTADPIVASPGTESQVVGSGDFNRDGFADILWQNANGSISIWEMNGATVLADSVIANPGNSWRPVGTGDFTGDGFTDDILWRNTDGSVAIWEMNGANVTADPVIGNPGTSWKVVGTGDFYGNGFSDILWQNTDGTVAIWEMSGATVTADPVIANPGTSWKAVGAGDFYGNGFSDILWQNTDGTVAIWEMNGATVVADPVIGNPGTAWKVIGAGNYYGDAHSDILFQNTDGTIAIWEMNGATVIADPIVGNPGTSWHPIPGSGSAASQTASLALLGQYAAAGFATAPDPSGTIVTDTAAQGGSGDANFLTIPQH